MKLLTVLSALIIYLGIASAQKKDSLATSGYVSVGKYWQPAHSIQFAGTSNKAVITIDYKDTILIRIHAPIDSAGKVFVDWVNQYYNWYVDSLKKENARLKDENNNTELLVKRLLMKK
jgi:hypothetical protein